MKTNGQASRKARSVKPALAVVPPAAAAPQVAAPAGLAPAEALEAIGKFLDQNGLIMEVGLNYGAGSIQPVVTVRRKNPGE